MPSRPRPTNRSNSYSKMEPDQVEMQMFEPGVEYSTNPAVRQQEQKRMDQYVHSMTDTVGEDPNLVILRKGETFVQGLKRMEGLLNAPGSLVLPPSQAGCCASVTVLDGEVGLARNGGRTFFIPPGNYFKLPLGVELLRTEQVHKSWDDMQRDFGARARGDENTQDWTRLEHMDINYVALPENHVAVVQQGNKQLVIGSGRYIFKKPTTLYGVVNIQNLKNKQYVTAYTEVPSTRASGAARLEEKHHGRWGSSGDSKDAFVSLSGTDDLKEVQLLAGEYEKQGAVTFLRARPGFCYVVSSSSGDLRVGIGYCVARNGDEFKRFVDRQHYSRTTRWFKLESKDRQEVRLRVQMRWRLEDAARWEMKKGASVDIFDAIEEIGQSHFRDAIASQSYEDCRSQAGQGYEGIEAKVRAQLAKETANLGGRLLGLEIRELRFPLLEAQNRTRANQEAQAKENVLAEGRRLDIQRAKATREEAGLQSQRQIEEQTLKHHEALKTLEAKQQIIEQETESQLQQMIQETESQLNLIRLDARKQKQQIELESEHLSKESRARIENIYKENEAAIEVLNAEADAKITNMKAQAEAKVNTFEAQATAASGDLIGAVYKNNKGYTALEMAKVKSKIYVDRAHAFARACQHNQALMVPPELQSELLSMDSKGL